MSKIAIEHSFDRQAVKFVLNAPKGNVLDSEMMRGLFTGLNGLKDDQTVKLVMFQGAGNHFSFGASVQEHRREKVGDMLKLFHSIFYCIMDLSVPCVALVSGQCLGGGMELAAICHFIFADKTARFGQPEIKLGVFPPAASVILPLKIGSARAEPFLLTGTSVYAREAMDIGLVNELYENRLTMETQTDRWIEKQIVTKSASSLKFATFAARKSFNETVKRELPKAEALYMERLMKTFDANEGIESFLEKRQPKWENR